MKRQIAMFVAMLALAATFAGCASIQKTTPAQLNSEAIASSKTTVAHVNATNWGLYFFMIPIFTGSVEQPGSIALLQDTVTVKDTARYLTSEAKKMGGTAAYGMASRINVWGWFFNMREVQISANIVR